MRILVVDDDPVIVELLRAILRADGNEVVTASNGLEALEHIRSGGCRLVISDWEMPQMTGVELCKAVRAEELSSYVYIILLTSHSRPADVVAGLSAGADDFLAKPCRPEELTVRVRTGKRILSLETRDLALFAMAKLAESRDPETGAHLDRVRIYSRILAEHLSRQPKYHGGIDAEFVRLIYLTSPLHDIGKVGIPDSVLLKPGRLSEREFSIMKEHASIGAQTLDAALRMYPGAKYLCMARDIAASHHERFDGTGYPQGLKGEEIPLAARIVALADVYDALTSNRVYKSAYGHEIAASMIATESGSHFDPDVVEAFVTNVEQFRLTQVRLSDVSPLGRANVA